MTFRAGPGIGRPALFLIAILLGACATIGEVDLPDEAGAANFREPLASILVAQGEPPEGAAAMAQRAVVDVGFGDLGLRPFVVGSRTTDYTFFVQRKEPGCVLRLISRARGFETYTNDITYIATRPLPACRCLSE